MLEVVKRHTFFYAHVAEPGAAQLRKERSTVQCPADVARQRADVCAFATLHAYLRLHLHRVEPQKFDVFHMYGLGVKFHFLVFAP